MLPCSDMLKFLRNACANLQTRQALRNVSLRHTIQTMCGRYALKHDSLTLMHWYEAHSMPALDAHYNIAPGTSILAVRETEEGRTGSMMRWGFIPSWAKDPASLPMLHNARGETVTEKPMFRRAIKRRRCLIPASGFYEWKAVPGQRSKQPFYVSYKDDSPMSFAGIWESYGCPDGTLIDTCTILTSAANAVLEPIHHRMPIILPRKMWSAWLAPDPIEPAALLAMIEDDAPEELQVWGVVHAVNRVTNNDPSLILPIA